MQILPTELNAGGFKLTQIKRKGKVAVYRQEKGGRTTSFELIVIKRQKAREAFGKQYPDREAYPSNEDWGTLAWSLAPDTSEAEIERRMAAMA